MYFPLLINIISIIRSTAVNLRLYTSVLTLYDLHYDRLIRNIIIIIIVIIIRVFSGFGNGWCPPTLGRVPPFPSPSPPLPVEVGPRFAARGSGGALKLPQRVRAEHGRQTFSGAYRAENPASGELLS